MNKLESLKHLSTLGERWQQSACELAGRHRHRAPWHGASARVAGRYEPTASNARSRFARLELEAAPWSESVATSARPTSRLVAAKAGHEPRAGLAVRKSDEPSARPAAERLPSAVRESLHGLLSAEVENVRVHARPVFRTLTGVDQRAVAPTADAVAIGKEIFLAPTEPRVGRSVSYGMLAHEAAHAVWSSRSETAVARSTAVGRDAEEWAAQGIASQALEARTWSSAPSDRFASPVVAAAPAMTTRDSASASPPRTTTLHPMFGREETAARPPMAPVAPPQLDLESLKQALMRDLMLQVRVDAERGG